MACRLLERYVLAEGEYNIRDPLADTSGEARVESMVLKHGREILVRPRTHHSLDTDTDTDKIKMR
jgi:hypothetical protein